MQLRLCPVAATVLLVSWGRRDCVDIASQFRMLRAAGLSLLQAPVGWILSSFLLRSCQCRSWRILLTPVSYRGSIWEVGTPGVFPRQERRGHRVQFSHGSGRCCRRFDDRPVLYPSRPWFAATAVAVFRIQSDDGFVYTASSPVTLSVLWELSPQLVFRSHDDWQTF